jgi:2',3'-cyclic-nucleotide 2'-phosphodiesterase/3'-nucleotidase
VVLEVTGQQLKDALEHSAKYFKSYVPGKPPQDQIDEKIPAYNFDIAEGVTYDLDISNQSDNEYRILVFMVKLFVQNKNFDWQQTTIG